MSFSKFNFLKYKKIYISISLFFFIFSLFFLFFGKLNLGIDMTGGTSSEYSYTKNIDLEKIKKDFEKEKESIIFEGKKIINNISIYSITGEKKVSLVVGFNDIGNDKELERMKISFKEKSIEIMKNHDDTSKELKYTNIGKAFGDYIKNTAYLTLGLAILGIFIYVYYAFSSSVSGISGFSFGFVTLLTLFHDVIVAAGIYIFIGKFYLDFQVDIYFITALLTIIGYSINDTIVIFDRIRENLKLYGGKKGKNEKNLKEIINLSVFETFKRSIYTSLTLVFVLITIFLFCMMLSEVSQAEKDCMLSLICGILNQSINQPTKWPIDRLTNH